MEYQRKIALLIRDIIESEGIDNFNTSNIGNYFGKVRYHSGVIKRHNQNGNITELVQDITVIIPRKIQVDILQKVKDTGYITIDNISYFINHFLVSDVLNNVILACRRGEI